MEFNESIDNYDIDCSVGVLVLHHNQFNGTIPTWMTKCNYTSLIPLRNNQFGGTLPSGWKVRAMEFDTIGSQVKNV